MLDNCRCLLSLVAVPQLSNAFFLWDFLGVTSLFHEITSFLSPSFPCFPIFTVSTGILGCQSLGVVSDDLGYWTTGAWDPLDCMNTGSWNKHSQPFCQSPQTFPSSFLYGLSGENLGFCIGYRCQLRDFGQCLTPQAFASSFYMRMKIIPTSEGCYWGLMRWTTWSSVHGVC